MVISTTPQGQSLLCLLPAVGGLILHSTPEHHGGRDISALPGQSFSWVTRMLSLALCMCECQTGDQCGGDLRIGEKLLAQAVLEVPLAQFSICSRRVETQWGKSVWWMQIDCARWNIQKLLQAAFGGQHVCVHSFVFFLSMCLHVYLVFFCIASVFGWCCRPVKISILLSVFVCLHLPVYVWVLTHACACVLTVMRGLEFATGGEFIITLIPWERYSLA